MGKRQNAGENRLDIVEEDYAETLVVIDGDFLGACIRNDQRFYKRVYPDKKLDHVELDSLCFEILFHTKVIDADKTFKFIIFHTQANGGFPFMKETFKDIGGKGLITDEFSVDFFTVETESEERLFLRVNSLLQSLNQQTGTDVDKESVIKKVVFCGDNPNYSEVIHAVFRRRIKELVLIRKTFESRMNVQQVKHVNVDYLVGKALGLTFDEL